MTGLYVHLGTSWYHPTKNFETVLFVTYFRLQIINTNILIQNDPAGRTGRKRGSKTSQNNSKKKKKDESDESEGEEDEEGEDEEGDLDEEEGSDDEKNGSDGNKSDSSQSKDIPKHFHVCTSLVKGLL